MSILVFGKTGQLARELQARAPVLSLGRDDVDLADPESCAAAIVARDPEAVINAAAYTAVDEAERDEELAIRINGDAPTSMARACAAKRIPFVQISTDYVFDGSGTRPWCPKDEATPISVYGRSKLAGELGVARAGGVYAILRTSWVFSRYGKNFVKAMLQLGADRDQLNVVADQIGGPTPAGSLADACLAIARQLKDEPNSSGIYHFSGSPDVSWADFAREIFTQADITCEIRNIDAIKYPTPAQRPQNSRLDCSALKTVFGIERPDWRVDLKQIINEELR